MNLNRTASAALLAASTVAGTAAAAFDPTMHSVTGNLSSFSTLIMSLDIATTSYNFPFDTNQFNTSGFVREINGQPVENTGLVTNVYQVNQQTSIGGLTLGVGDMVFAYTIDLVSASTNTVTSLSEFQVGGLSFLGSDVMDGSLILGRGFLMPGAGVDTPLGNPGDFSDLGAAGSSLDWQWGPTVAEQLGNSESITLLMFTSAANIGNGLANFIAPPIQAPGVSPVATGAPVLIPVLIPAPGVTGLFVAFGAMHLGRRRR